MSIGRRRFLELTGAGLALSQLPLGAGCETPAERRTAPPEPEPSDGAQATTFDPSTYTEDAALFSRGLQAGAMRPGSALLWTYASAAAELTLHVFRTKKDGTRVMVKQLPAALTDGFTKVPVGGLGPGWYEYVFTTTDGRRSKVGRFRTAFAADDERPLTIGALVCTKLEHPPFDAVKLTLDASPDVVCHLGDFVYADGSVTLTDYRSVWQRTFDEGNYRENLGRAGLYYTWDDHEFANNFDPVEFAANHAEQYDAAKQAALESVATEGVKDKIWGSYLWGKTAEIFVLDCRTERVPSTRGTPQATYVSEAQLTWLLDGLAASKARYKVIMSSVPIARLSGLWEAGIPDRWQGYDAQRQRLLDHLISKDIQDVLFLTGDFHCQLVMRVEPTGPASRFWEVAVGPTGNGPNPIASLADAGYLDRNEIYPPAQIAWGSAIWPAATTVTLDPLNDEVRVRFVDARPGSEGAVLFDAALPK